MKVTSYIPPQSEDFEFTPENLEKAKAYIARYPEGRQVSAVLWLLYLAQEQNDGWLSVPAIEYVAKLLNMPPIRVHEVVSFFTMFKRRPVGRYQIQVCRTTSCWLRGSDEITAAAMEEAGVTSLEEVSADGLFSVIEVECLGACSNAPVFQVSNEHYYEDLTPERAKAVIRALRNGESPQPGSQAGRVSSEPEGGLTSLTELQGNA